MRMFPGSVEDLMQKIATPEDLQQIAALQCLRHALTNLTAAEVRFDTGQTGANWYKIKDVAIEARTVKDPGVIVVSLEPADPPRFARVQSEEET